MLPYGCFVFELIELIVAKLVGEKKDLSKLFDFNGPFGTFSACIKVSYSLGLLSNEAKTDLEIIRKVRNDFAHTYELLDFESQEIKSRVLSLKTHFYLPGEASRTRALFTSSVLAILAEIHAFQIILPKFKVATNLFFSDPEKKEYLRLKKNEGLQMLWDSVEKRDKNNEAPN